MLFPARALHLSDVTQVSTLRARAWLPPLTMLNYLKLHLTLVPSSLGGNDLLLARARLACAWGILDSPLCMGRVSPRPSPSALGGNSIMAP